MLVELKGKSLKGVFALAHNQGAIAIRTITKRPSDKLWRLGVVFGCGVTSTMNEKLNKRLLFKQGLNQGMLAEKLGVKAPYVSSFLIGRGKIPRVDWQKLYEYFLELRVTQ